MTTTPPRWRPRIGRDVGAVVVDRAGPGGNGMVISQPAIICFEAATEWVRRGLRRSGLGRASVPPAATAMLAEASGVADGLAGVGETEVVAAEPSPPEPLSATERRARAAAWRALLLARQRRFEAARVAFADAARLDPALDLTSVPTFWHLERGAHEAAVDAYEQTGRSREAVALEARLRQIYRPRLLASPPTGT